MNIEVFQDFPIRARVAYAIMCCERYVAAVYPELDLRPLSDLMWHIVDGSESVDNASYKCSENIPKYLCNYNTYGLQKLIIKYYKRSLTQETQRFFLIIES